ncbi:hypothetical protein, partial [Dryocola clanedunensis]
VGLLDLRTVVPANLAHLQQLLVDHRHMSLLALLPAAPLRSSPVLDALLAACVDTYVAPIDLPRVVQRLQQLAGAESLP